MPHCVYAYFLNQVDGTGKSHKIIILGLDMRSPETVEDIKWWILKVTDFVTQCQK